MITLINVGICYFTYEIGVGCVVVYNQIFREGKKWVYVPWSPFFAKGHEKYEEWKEWKGDQF